MSSFVIVLVRLFQVSFKAAPDVPEGLQRKNKIFDPDTDEMNHGYPEQNS
jgi:hypothetical protein